MLLRGLVRAGRIRPISTRSSWLAVNHHRRWDAVATHRVRRLQPRAGRIRPISTRSSWLAVRRSTWSARTRSVPRRSALASSVAQAAAVELLLLDPVQTSNESRSASSSFTASTAHRHWSRRLSRAAEWWQAGQQAVLQPGRFTTRGVLTRSLTARIRGWGLWAGKPPGVPLFSGCSRPQIAETAPD